MADRQTFPDVSLPAGRRNRSFFWPAVLILIGVVALLVNSGLISNDRLGLLADLWPVVLIVIGLEIIVRRGVQGSAGNVAAALIVLLAAGGTIAVEVKRRGDIDGVEQLTRYLELLGRDPHLAPVTGVFAAQEIKPQARVLAADRGIRCVTLDYDGMKGVDSGAPRLF